MVFCLGTEGSKSFLLRNAWSQWFSVQELQVPMVNYLEMGGSNGFLFRTEGSKGSLFRNWWFHWFSVQELKVPMVNYLEMGGSDRKSVVQGKSVDLGGRRIIKKTSKDKDG